ncbi:hypothetical protein [Streptomyces sp. NPDC021622]|uniref:hypothetical protein n=1 Tax=Streptomyces sp. NPDC021622 TaxID=3155013 RepID=UPI0033FD26B5
MSRFEQAQTPKLPHRGSRATLTPDHLLDTPLSALLAELDVTLDDSEIADPGFTGAAVVTQDRIVLSMRLGQPPCERDAIARLLLGQALNVPLPPLPGPYRITEM